MTEKQIISLRKQGHSNDHIYELAAGNYNLFGIAFFGHHLSDRKAHKVAKAKLNRVWNRILKVDIILMFTEAKTTYGNTLKKLQ